MKKRNVINLIRYHVEGNDAAFHREAVEIANDLLANGDTELAEYIMALISDAHVLVPQIVDEHSGFSHGTETAAIPASLPAETMSDTKGS